MGLIGVVSACLQEDGTYRLPGFLIDQEEIEDLDEDSAVQRMALVRRGGAPVLMPVWDVGRDWMVYVDMHHFGWV